MYVFKICMAFIQFGLNKRYTTYDKIQARKVLLIAVHIPDKKGRFIFAILIKGKNIAVLISLLSTWLRIFYSKR